MPDQTLHQHAAAIMCDAARNAEVHTIREHLEDQTGAEVDALTVQEVADLIAKASITIDWPDQPSEAGRLRDELDRANTGRQQLQEELDAWEQTANILRAQLDRVRAELTTQLADITPEALAEARQNLAHRGTGYVPEWRALNERERELSTIEAGHWLTAIRDTYDTAARR